MQILETKKAIVQIDIYLEQWLGYKIINSYRNVIDESTLYRLRVGPLHLDIEVTRKQKYQGLETKSR